MIYYCGTYGLRLNWERIEGALRLHAYSIEEPLMNFFRNRSHLSSTMMLQHFLRSTSKKSRTWSVRQKYLILHVLHALGRSCCSVAGKTRKENQGVNLKRLQAEYYIKILGVVFTDPNTDKPLQYHTYDQLEISLIFWKSVQCFWVTLLPWN